MIPDSFYGPAFSNERTIVLLVAGADPEIFSGGWLQQYTTVYWRGIKFGGLAVLGETAKLKSAKLFGGNPPNLMIANISSYTVFIGMHCACIILIRVSFRGGGGATCPQTLLRAVLHRSIAQSILTKNSV